jgi:ADP-ribose pyrophosphatase YjhB (NUDIX family)
VTAPEAGEPIPRAAARALLLDPAGRVLLVHFADAETGYAWWATPGGGLRPGETPEAAVHREVFEETGLRDLRLGPCVWLRDVEYGWRGRRYRQREHVFVARVEAFEPSRAWLQADERELLVEHRWWTAEEIERSPERFGPRRLGGLLRALLRDGLPPEPLRIGV